MTQHSHLPDSDLRATGLLAVMLACLVGLVVLLLRDPSIDTSRIEPMLSAHAAVLTPALAVEPKTTTPNPASTSTTKPVTPEENWVADESSAGLRPDAAH